MSRYKMANAFQNVVYGGPLAWCFFALALYGIFVAVRNKAPFGLVGQGAAMVGLNVD